MRSLQAEAARTLRQERREQTQNQAKTEQAHAQQARGQVRSAPYRALHDRNLEVVAWATRLAQTGKPPRQTQIRRYEYSATWHSPLITIEEVPSSSHIIVARVTTQDRFKDLGLHDHWVQSKLGFFVASAAEVKPAEPGKRGGAVDDSRKLPQSVSSFELGIPLIDGEGPLKSINPDEVESSDIWPRTGVSGARFAPISGVRKAFHLRAVQQHVGMLEAARGRIETALAEQPANRSLQAYLLGSGVQAQP